MFLMIDNYDSFTYNLVQYFEELGEEMEVYRNNDDINRIDFSKYAGIVLSPGPSNPKNSGITLDIIKNCSRYPILGVCLGMQSMAYVFGGEIVRAKRIMHGKVDTIRHLDGDLFNDIPAEFTAVRYHSLVASAESLPGCFEIKAYSSDDEIMSIKHTSHYMWGVQFHPESHLTEYGLKLIKNFIGGAYENKVIH